MIRSGTMSHGQIAEGPPPNKRRRVHTKSRTGCIMCKQRHIRCDETRPSCKNCLQRALSCQYLPDIPQHTSLPSLAMDHRGDSKKRPGRPRKFTYPSEVTASRSAWEDFSHDTVSVPEQHLSMDLVDFELLHHYYTSTWSSFSLDKPIQSMYQTEIPRMALSYPFVLRLLLALAGQHLYHLLLEDGRNHEAERYARIAEKHFCAAIPRVRLLFSDFARETRQTAYVSAILVCIHLLARGPMPGEYLVFNEQDPPLWIELLQGVKRIKSAFGDRHFGWPAKTETNNTLQTVRVATVTAYALPRVYWQLPLRRLRSFIESNGTPESREVYHTAFEALWQIFEATYGSEENGLYKGDALQHIVFRWLYMLDDQMVRHLQQKEPHALLLVGYYAILLRIPELIGCWFAKGWSHHILKGVHAVLKEQYRYWLEWPFASAGLKWDAAPLSLV